MNLEIDERVDIINDLISEAADIAAEETFENVKNVVSTGTTKFDDHHFITDMYIILKTSEGMEPEDYMDDQFKVEYLDSILASVIRTVSKNTHIGFEIVGIDLPDLEDVVVTNPDLPTKVQIDLSFIVTVK